MKIAYDIDGKANASSQHPDPALCVMETFKNNLIFWKLKEFMTDRVNAALFQLYYIRKHL